MQKNFREVRNKLLFITIDNLDFPTHIHDDIELIFVKKGGGTACCDGKKYKLNNLYLSWIGYKFLLFVFQMMYNVRKEWKNGKRT